MPSLPDPLLWDSDMYYTLRGSDRITVTENTISNPGFFENSSNAAALDIVDRVNFAVWGDTQTSIYLGWAYEYLNQYLNVKEFRVGGGVGSDYICASQNTADYINGYGGKDTVSYSLIMEYVSIRVFKDHQAWEDAGSPVGEGAARGDVLIDIEEVVGTLYNDEILASTTGNMLYGGAGDDLLLGNYGYDNIFGEDGDDIIRGADGNDRLSGGFSDIFYSGFGFTDGDDLLAGGFGDDIFEFNRFCGNDEIEDFYIGSDVIKIFTDKTVKSFSDINIDVVDSRTAKITFKGNDIDSSILVRMPDEVGLSESDFIFV